MPAIITSIAAICKESSTAVGPPTHKRRCCVNGKLCDPLFFYPHSFHRDASGHARIFGKYSVDFERCVTQSCFCFKQTSFVMSRSNYRIYMNVGHNPTEMLRALAVLDTGAPRNLVRAEMLPPRWGPFYTQDPRATSAMPTDDHYGSSEQSVFVFTSTLCSFRMISCFRHVGGPLHIGDIVPGSTCIGNTTA